MKNIPMRLIDTPDCATCDRTDCTKDCLSFPHGQSVKVCPSCKAHSIVNAKQCYKFCPECGQAIIEEKEDTTGAYDMLMHILFSFPSCDVFSERARKLHVLKVTLKEFRADCVKPGELVEIIDTDKDRRFMAARSDEGELHYSTYLPPELINEIERRYGDGK